MKNFRVVAQQVNDNRPDLALCNVVAQCWGTHSPRFLVAWARKLFPSQNPFEMVRWAREFTRE